MRAVSGWTELRRTSKTLIVCWVASIAIPLATALIPVEYLVDVDSLRQQAIANGDASGGHSTIVSLHVLFAINYALTLLPVVLSVPGGVLKGAARVKSLFPSASLPGWFLVSVAPFYSMFTIVVFVLIDQIVGNFLLVIGVGILAFTPWLFVIYRKVYARPLSMAEARTELARASRVGGWLLIASVFCIVIYAFTAKVEGQHVLGSDNNKAFFSYLDVGRTLAEVFSRTIVTTVVFSTVFLQMIYADWMTMQSMRADIRQEHDSEMMGLQRYLGNPGANPGAPQAWVPGPPAPRA
jgi:hypothetical protein